LRHRLGPDGVEQRVAAEARDHQHPEPQLVAHGEPGELEDEAQKEDAADQYRVGHGISGRKIEKTQVMDQS
jgi:hypothetical protein